MPGFPVPFIKFREDDANGFPLAGGKLYSYAAGTSTPLATFSDQALTTPNLNPTILDASGRASIFVEDGVGYKFVLNDPLDNLIWSEDNIEVPEILAPSPPAEVPPGGIVMYGGNAAPPGWLLCDGSSVSTVTYANLFAVVLYTFGGAGGTFSLPDLRQKFPIGKAVSGTGSTLGGSGGAIDHSHTGGSHTHTVAAHTHSIAGHTHAVPYNGWGTVFNTPPLAGILQAGGSGAGQEFGVTQASGNNTSGASSSADTSGTAVTTDAGGTAATSTANPPFIALNFIIKT